MSFEDEWAQSKAEAARDSSVHTRLNMLPSPPGGYDPDLEASQFDLAKVAHAAYQLHGGLQAAGGHADKSSKSAGSELSGSHLTSGPALTKLAETWETQVKTLLEACAHISNHLALSAEMATEHDEKIATGFQDAKHRLMTPSRIAEYYN
ncbi:hypothetical protein [Streptomyces sp. UNOC14_S4]|uniref:hypothetical protein n=1 Tax=Streptomyces sp. UNOC14_S4 TaxID=2872340 RepID=UPI001E4AD872|nr:hypothetical protein [Streptomyces sp. UNOC14_S4]MCC3771073.1 hypothetical protein [Streptomyces sp. UNOC14_S4]